jgi:tRNA(fMet)-specific endonuclease VapC
MECWDSFRHPSLRPWYAKERVRLQTLGKPYAYADGEIAAIAVSQNLTLVTRNTKDFMHFQALILENWFE